MRKKITILLYLITCLAIANNEQTNTKISAQLSNSCQFMTSDVVFGDYNPNNSLDLETTQSVNIKCTKGTAYSLATYSQTSYRMTNLNGVPVNGSVASMSASGTSDKLYFQIREDHYTPGYWDEDMNLSDQQYKGIGTGMFENISFSYRIIKNQYVKPANYSATQTMTITF